MNTTKVGIFLDIENLLGSIYSIGLPLNFDKIVEFGKTYGDVIYKKSYGDIFKALSHSKDFISFEEVRENLAKASFAIEDIPYITLAKNSADMSLALDCHKKSLMNEIETAIVISEDKDFIPLYKSLRELGITVVVITTNINIAKEKFKNYANEIISYQSILDIEIETTLQDSIVEEILQISLPSKDGIIDILDTAKKVLTHKMSLKKLTHTVCMHTSYPQEVIYKILLSLIFSKTLEIEKPIVKNNPVILRLSNQTTEELYNNLINQFNFLLKKHTSEN